MPNYIFVSKRQLHLRTIADPNRKKRKAAAGDSHHLLSKAATAALCLAFSVANVKFAHAQFEDGETLTLNQALELAVERSPRAQLLEAQLESIEGQIDQSLIKPNPSVGAELENVLGTGELSGVDAAELTVGISQLLERREKREKRAEAASTAKELLRWDFEEALAELRSEVRNAYYQAVLAQESVLLQNELLEIASSSQAEVKRRADAAKASSIEVSQARLAVDRQRFEITRAERELRAAKTRLAAVLYESAPGNFLLEGTVELEADLPEFNELAKLLDHSPTLARFDAERVAQEAVVELEIAESKGDMEVFGGVKYAREGGDDAAFVVGIDIPWQIRNPNAGNIRSARAGLLAVEAKRRIAKRDALTALSQSYANLKNAYDEWHGLTTSLLPAAESTVEATQSGYQQGLVTLLSVLEARTHLFEIRSEMLEATQRYLEAQTEIARLTATANQQIQ